MSERNLTLPSARQRSSNRSPKKNAPPSQTVGAPLPGWSALVWRGPVLPHRCPSVRAVSVVVMVMVVVVAVVAVVVVSAQHIAKIGTTYHVGVTSVEKHSRRRRGHPHRHGPSSSVVVMVLPPSPLSPLPPPSPWVVVVVVGSRGSHIRRRAWSSPPHSSWPDVVIPGDVWHLQAAASSSTAVPLAARLLPSPLPLNMGHYAPVGVATVEKPSRRRHRHPHPRCHHRRGSWWVIAVRHRRRRQAAANEMACSLGAVRLRLVVPVVVTGFHWPIGLRWCHHCQLSRQTEGVSVLTSGALDFPLLVLG